MWQRLSHRELKVNDFSHTAHTEPLFSIPGAFSYLRKVDSAVLPEPKKPGDMRGVLRRTAAVHSNSDIGNFPEKTDQRFCFAGVICFNSNF